MTKSAASSISRSRQAVPWKTNDAVLDKQRQTSSATRLRNESQLQDRGAMMADLAGVRAEQARHAEMMTSRRMLGCMPDAGSTGVGHGGKVQEVKLEQPESCICGVSLSRKQVCAHERHRNQHTVRSICGVDGVAADCRRRSCKKSASIGLLIYRMAYGVCRLSR